MIQKIILGQVEKIVITFEDLRANGRRSPNFKGIPTTQHITTLVVGLFVLIVATKLTETTLQPAILQEKFSTEIH
jgi:hypothetical protein